MQCSNNLKQIALAAHNFHDVHNAFPMGQDNWGQEWGLVEAPNGTNYLWCKRVSGFVWLLAFLEQSALYDLWMVEYDDVMVGPATGRITDARTATKPVPNARFSWGYRCPRFPESLRTMAVPFLACPSDDNGNKSFRTNFDHGDGTTDTNGANVTLGRSGNYVQSLGDFVNGVTWGNGTAVAPYYDGTNYSYGSCSRGPLRPCFETGIEEITDGTSNTALFSERCAGDGTDIGKGGSIFSRLIIDENTAMPSSSTGGSIGFNTAKAWNPGACLAYREGRSIRNTLNTTGWGGTNWYNASSQFSWYQHILPPNSPSCARLLRGANTYPDDPSLLPPTSYHTGGVNMALTDASCRFVTETVDTGNLSGAAVGSNNGKCVMIGPSNFGIWGAFGSKDGGEGVGAP
jgi:hypothetical protein